MRKYGFRLQCFRAVLDRIIPVDAFPSATQAGVDRFILALWDAGLVVEKDEICSGLNELDQKAGGKFEQLGEADQDQLLEASHTGIWFSKLCELSAEGFYSDPGNGANPNAISWQMIGYLAGLPEGPDGPRMNAKDAVRGKLWA